MFRLPHLVRLKSRDLEIKDSFHHYLTKLVEDSDFHRILEAAGIFENCEGYFFVAFLQFMLEYDTGAESINKQDAKKDSVVTFDSFLSELDGEKLKRFENQLSELHKTVFFSLAYTSTDGLDLKSIPYLTTISKAIKESKPSVIDSRKLAYAGMVDSERDLW